MAGLTVARTAVANHLRGVTDLVVFAYVPDSGTPPLAVVEPASIDYLQVYGTTDSMYDLQIRIVTGRINEQAAQDLLDEYVSPDGAKSIPLLIEQDNTLGGTVDYCVATGMTGYGSYTIGAVEYIGATISIEVAV